MKDFSHRRNLPVSNFLPRTNTKGENIFISHKEHKEELEDFTILKT